jgi:hypothetical protein
MTRPQISILKTTENGTGFFNTFSPSHSSSTHESMIMELSVGPDFLGDVQLHLLKHRLVLSAVSEAREPCPCDFRFCNIAMTHNGRFWSRTITIQISDGFASCKRRIRGPYTQ